MDDLKSSILKQQMQAALEEARKLEAAGNSEAAGSHYLRAGTIARMLASSAGGGRSAEFSYSAGQYESVGKVMKDEDASADLAESLIVSQKPSTKWADIGGLEEAKSTLKEAIIMPFIGERPDFVRATRSILLYGPPGTGKTLLAKASANTLSATFFEAKASGLLSKYFGESTKIIAALFAKAEKMKPSLVFMDEIDSIAASRGRDIDDASRRVLGQLLSELDGFSSERLEKVVFIGATNKPWDLDDALLSRFQRKVFVPLPDAESRERIFTIHLKGVELGGIDSGYLAARSANYSGRDIESLCQAAISAMVREKNKTLESLDADDIASYRLATRPLAKADFDAAFRKVKPTSDARALGKYAEWEREFG